MKRSILGIVCSIFVSFLCVLTCSFDQSIPVSAETENTVTVETNKELSKGCSYYGHVFIESLENIASLRVSVHFDSNVIKVNDTYSLVYCSLFDGAVQDEAITYTYVFTSEGQYFKTELFYFSYSVDSNTNASASFFDVTIDEAYDSSLNVVEVHGSLFRFNIKENQTVVKECYIYATSFLFTRIEEEFELSMSFSTNEIAAGTIEIKYDKELFEFVSITQLELLKNKMVDINTSLDSSVMLSFLGTDYSFNGSTLRIKFRTICNKTVDTNIIISASGLYDLEFNSYSCADSMSPISIVYDSNYDDTLPRFYLTSKYNTSNDQVTILANLSANSRLGAGDFVIDWDTNSFDYISYTKKFTPSFFNVNDKQVLDGQLKFSIISLTDIDSSSEIIEVVLAVKHQHDSVSPSINITGSGLADSLTNPIRINFINISQTIDGVCTFGEWSVSKAPTCTEKGIEHRLCTVCNREETREIDANGHDWETEWTVDVEATCEHEGSKSHHCTRCDEKKDITVIEKTEHIPSEPVRENEVSPTCTENGSYDIVVYCSVCNKELSREHIVVDSDDHHYGDWETIKNATCTEKGIEQRMCSVCGHIDTREIDAKGHTPAAPVRENSVSETCTDSGSYDEVVYCEICNEEISREHKTIDALGHDWETEWTVDVEATCEHEGSKSHHCTRCDEKKDITVIEKTEHIPSKPVRENEVSPTCTENGSYDLVTYCSFCGKELSRETKTSEATGHQFGEWSVVKNPTCSEKGLEHRICSVCNHEETREIDAKGHVPAQSVRENEVAATCTENGSYDEVIYCQECHEEISRVMKTIQATGHNFGGWVVVKESTYSEKGIEKHTCSVCGFTETREIDKVDCTNIFKDSVNSINTSKDSTEVIYSKIQQALVYYGYIDDKASVNESYLKLKDIIASYNADVGLINGNHEKVSSNILEIMLGVIASVNLVSLGLYLARKRVFKI